MSRLPLWSAQGLQLLLYTPYLPDSMKRANR